MDDTSNIIGSAADDKAGAGSNVQASGQGGAAAGGAATGAAGAADTKLTPEQQAAASKQAADTKAAELAAKAEIEIKLPEGYEADATAIGDFKKLAKEVGLTSESAQKLFDFNAKLQQAQAKAQEVAADQQEKAWEAELKADPDFGGKNFEGSKVLLNKLLVKFDDKDKGARKAIGASGLGSQPAVVKFLHRIAKSMAEDKVGAGAGSGGEPVLSEDEKLAARYPKSIDAMKRA